MGYGYLSPVGDQYPETSADDVKAYIEMMTCQKVIDVPQYVGSLHDYPPGPFWKLTTGDGQVFYVIGNYAPSEFPKPAVTSFFRV